MTDLPAPDPDEAPPPRCPRHLETPTEAPCRQCGIQREARALWEALNRPACDAHRPLGPDGKHGDRHTPTCGCDEDAPSAPLMEDITEIVGDGGPGIRTYRQVSASLSPPAAERPPVVPTSGSDIPEPAETTTARCAKCGTPRNPCTDCGKPSQCGDLRCVDCEPGWGES